MLRRMNQLISSLERSIGSFSVRRVLPTVRRRTIGPFVFLDHMGPVKLPASSLQVPPHPHIGLSTLTYLFEGSLVHRDSVGSNQLIEPGAVNWMKAGAGIVHSERPSSGEPNEIRAIHGLQAWVALPLDMESSPPSFTHYSRDQIPRFERGDMIVSLAVGELWGHSSPVAVPTPTLFAELLLDGGAEEEIPNDYEQQGLYLIEGEVVLTSEAGDEVDEVKALPGQLWVMAPGASTRVRAIAKSRVLVLGGEALSERRHLDWNFCASDKALIEAAKVKYREGELGVIEGEEPQLPLPEDVR